ncbi:hypothetical protein JXA56_04485 [Candidatus Micrarchaeota archaeon]|nr:hypothetical protein [Candidatus Micrarchaeota archaeon]
MILEYFEDRFGIPKAHFSEYQLYQGHKGKYYLGPKTIDRPQVISPGLLIARAEKQVKPTSNFLQLFGHLATKNILELSKPDAKRYIEGYDLRIEANADPGYVIVSYSGNFLGCAFLKDGLMTNNLPKAKRQQVKYL